MKILNQILCIIFLRISGMAAALKDEPPPLYLPEYRMNFSEIHHLKTGDCVVTIQNVTQRFLCNYTLEN
jgi:hypothetical protein